MLVIEENQSDWDCANDERKDKHDFILGTDSEVLNSWKRLVRSDVHVHSTGDSKDDTNGRVRRISGQHHDPTKHHGQTRNKIKGGGFHDRQSRCLSKKDEIGQFLCHFVEDGGDDDGNGNRAGAREEGSTDENTIAKVVEGISDEDGGAELFVYHGVDRCDLSSVGRVHVGSDGDA
mmetsp:Transcript_23017/g.48315  ORF Transcript_23017/g.48315 Transcript_23017/m.48315 type:complete len:176 (-) Transcript_23017:529-1056(-)